MNVKVILEADELDSLLSDMNDRGVEPTVVGFDANEVPFLAYGWDQGDTMGVGISLGDPFEDYRDTRKCPECTASERLPLDAITYPALVF